MENKSVVYVDGLFLNHVHPNAPEFIVSKAAIHVERLKKWLDENAALADEKGYIKIVGMEAKDTVDERGNKKRYFQIDTWKPVDAVKDEVSKDEIPF